MPESLVFNRPYQVLKKSLNLASRKHSLITGNIANLNTVGYKPKDIDFQKALTRELNNEQSGLYRTNEKHFEKGSDLIREGSDREGKEDEYNLDSVNIDFEMANLMENSIKYRTSVEMLLRKIAGLRHVIQEGGR